MAATHTIRTRFRPDLEITVSHAEYEQLLEQGLIYDGTPPVEPVDAFDARMADRIDDPVSLASLRLRAALDPDYGGRTVVTVDGVYVPTLDIDSAPPVMPTCRIYANATAQTIGHEGYGYVKMNATEVNDDPALFVVASVSVEAFGPTLSIAPTEDGLYLAHWTATFNSGGAGQRSAALVAGSVTKFDSGGAVPAGGWIAAGSAAPVRLTAGDPVTVVAYIETGGGAAAEVLSDLPYVTGLSLTRLGS